MRWFAAVALGALLFVASAAARPAAFTGNVCKFVSTAKVTAINGVSAKCTNAPPSAGIGSKIYVGNWAGKTPKSPSVQVTIAHYTDSGALKLATSNLKQGLPGGTPKKVKGIGTAAFEATAADATGIHFLVGKYIVYMSLNAVGANPPAPARTALESLAKSVAAQL
jgi:hypothetical protein